MGTRVRDLVTSLGLDWRVTRQYVLRMIKTSLVFVVVLLGVLLLLHNISPFFHKTDWQLLKVLAVPITIGAAVPLLNWLQKKRELDVEHQRAQDEALQGYLDQISKLLTDGEHPLRRGQPGDNLSEVARTLARARTLTALARLDADHKRSVLLFLYEAGLVMRGTAVVDLKGADLSAANLGLTDLSAANLHRADLSEADLSEADLSEANLLKAVLREADLRGADLKGAHMQKADLGEADLREADLRETDLREAHLTAAILSKDKLKEADLRGAYLNATDLKDADLSKDDLSGADLSAANLHRAKLSEADLSKADLSAAILSRADMSRADLRGADLMGANLIGADLNGADLNGADLRATNLHRANLRRVNLHSANLTGADLREADLRSAVGLTKELLDQVESLEGATMPNGHKYEDRSKGGEGRREDAENSSPSKRV